MNHANEGATSHSLLPAQGRLFASFGAGPGWFDGIGDSNIEVTLSINDLITSWSLAANGPPMLYTRPENEIADAMEDSSIDVEVQERYLRQNEQKSEADTNYDMKDPTKVKVTIYIDGYNRTTDDQIEHEWGHEHDMRIAPSRIQQAIKAYLDKQKYPDKSQHDDRPTEKSADQFKDQVNREKKEYKKRLKQERDLQKKQQKNNRKQPTQCHQSHRLSFDPFDGEPE